MKDTHNSEKTLGAALVQSIGMQEITGLSRDVTEIALDSLLEDGIIKEIPIMKVIYTLGKSAISIRDRIFAKKILTFLTSMETTSPEERERLSTKMSEDDGFCQRVGETLIMILDRYDHMRKPEFLATLFQGYLRDDIDFEQFQRLASAIDRAIIIDLIAMLDYFTKVNGKAKTQWAPWENLYFCGLSKITVYPGNERDRLSVAAGGPPIPNTESTVKYTFSRDAEILARIILGKKYRFGN